jgi:hypothetical protein
MSNVMKVKVELDMPADATDAEINHVLSRIKVDRDGFNDYMLSVSQFIPIPNRIRGNFVLASVEID